MKDKLRELVVKIIHDGESLPMLEISKGIYRLQKFNDGKWTSLDDDELLAILDTEGDGGAVGGFSMPQSFVDRVTSSDEDEPPVMGAGCVDSIKRIAEEMVSACKAERQGDAEFTPEAMDDWAHRIMCFADYIPAHPARSGVVSDEDVEISFKVMGDTFTEDFPDRQGRMSDADIALAKRGIRAALESYERNRK